VTGTGLKVANRCRLFSLSWEFTVAKLGARHMMATRIEQLRELVNQLALAPARCVIVADRSSRRRSKLVANAKLCGDRLRGSCRPVASTLLRSAVGRVPPRKRSERRGGVAPVRVIEMVAG